MEELNVIYDSGSGHRILSSGHAADQEYMTALENSGWVSSQLDQTTKAALDPEYPALAQVLEYRAALRAYRDNNYEGDRPQLEV